MNTTQGCKKYDLEDRTFQFAACVRRFVKKLSSNVANREDISQLINSSGSVGANYIEANEAISKKDFFHRIKICRKEAKESKFWLKLLDTGLNNDLDVERNKLIQESTELTNIFGAILKKNI